MGVTAAGARLGLAEIEAGDEPVEEVLGDRTARRVIATADAVLIAYCLLAFEKADAVHASVPWYQLSILPFVLGLLRYALLVDQGKGAAPEDIVLGDRALQIIGVLWAVVFGLGVYAS